MAFSYPVEPGPMAGAEFPPGSPGDGGNEFQYQSTIFADETCHPVRSITFDPYEELIWSCTDTGRLSAHFDMQMPNKYISVQVGKMPLHCLTVNHPNIDNGVFVLDEKNLYYYSKYGQRKKVYSHPSMNNLVCMLYRPLQSHVLVAGRQNRMICLDTNTGDVLHKTPVDESGVVILKESLRYICGGSLNGKIALFDPNALGRPAHELFAHTGQVSDMTVQENMLITCGWSMRQNGSMVPDRLLKVYDLRFVRPLKPISMMAFDPCFVRFVSLLYNHLLVISSFGHYQFLDIGNTIANYKYYTSPIAGSQVTDIALSASCRVMAISDDGGCVHVFSPDAQPQINRTMVNPEIPDSAIDYSLGPLGFDEYQYPLTAVPFAYPDSDAAYPLSSDWPEELLGSRDMEMAPIEQELLDSVQVKNGLRLARKPAHWGSVHFPYRRLPRDLKSG